MFLIRLITTKVLMVHMICIVDTSKSTMLTFYYDLIDKNYQTNKFE